MALTPGVTGDRDGGRRGAVAGAVSDVGSEHGAGFPAFPHAEEAWAIVIEGFDPMREREFESWLAVGNGVTGTRGSLEEGHDASSPATYVSGAYVDAPGGGGNPELAVVPEWTRLVLVVDDTVVTLDVGEVIEHRRVLDLRHAVLTRVWRQRLPSGKEMVFRSARFASMADPRLLVLWAEAHADDGEAHFADTGKPLVEVSARTGAIELASLTRHGSGRIVRLSAVRRPALGDRREDPPLDVLADADRHGAGGLLARHRTAWEARWRAADVVIDGDADAQRALRFALYHLMSAGDGSGIASIGARGLTGGGYHGHVFWDTDVFVLPFFIATHPPTARALLEYRHRLLPAARAKAAALGYAGALYPWESADTGEEVTPPSAAGPRGERIPILTGRQEQHISADVAWAAWQYWQMTGDDDFLVTMGAELLVETARFWASRATRRRDRRFHIGRVIGPDEYHESVDDNAFTNVLARWNLEQAAQVVEDLRARPGEGTDTVERLAVTPQEVRRWRRVAAGLVDGFNPHTGLYEQFAGFFGLESVVAAGLAPRPFAADLVLGRDRLRRSQVIKQADVVMLAHMLPEVVPVEVAAANYRYYEPRTSHGSSLSPAIHAAVAARVGALDDALAYFRLAAAIDLADGMGNAAHGVHMAALGGLWQAAVAGFGGTRADGNALHVDPRVPPAWRRLAFPVLWRGGRVEVEVVGDRLMVTLDAPADVAVGGHPPRRLGPGRHAASRRAQRWSELREVTLP